MMLTCKFCKQPIYSTSFVRGLWRHVFEDAFHCDESKISPDVPKPKCHICGTETDIHGPFCSAAGTPRHRAKPME